MTPDDHCLVPLRNFAVDRQVTLIAGGPLPGRRLPRIGAFIFAFDGGVDCYAKLYLHSGEDRWFEAGSGDRILSRHGEQVALAICADLTHPAHARRLKADGATVYVASVVITANGYQADTAFLSQYAASLAAGGSDGQLSRPDR